MRRARRIFPGLIVVAVLFAAAAGAGSAPTSSMPRGEHLANVMGCTSCHAANFSGTKVFDDPSSVVIWAQNLTRGKGGFLATHGQADFEHAVRHGVGPDGKKLLIMPSFDYAGLSDADLSDIYAYIRSARPVDRVTPKVKFGSGAGDAIAAGIVRYDADRLAHSTLPAFDSKPAVSAAYGRYLTRIVGCQGCHGEALTGSPPGVPVGAPGLTPTTIGTWTEANFVTTIRTGRTPTGGSLGNIMPWREFAHLSDDELHAIYLYLRTL